MLMPPRRRGAAKSKEFAVFTKPSTWKGHHQKKPFSGRRVREIVAEHRGRKVTLVVKPHRQPRYEYLDWYGGAGYPRQYLVSANREVRVLEKMRNHGINVERFIGFAEGKGRTKVFLKAEGVHYKDLPPKKWKRAREIAEEVKRKLDEIGIDAVEFDLRHNFLFREEGGRLAYTLIDAELFLDKDRKGGRN
jgi:hypothetical protein